MAIVDFLIEVVFEMLPILTETKSVKKSLRYLVTVLLMLFFIFTVLVLGNFSLHLFNMGETGFSIVIGVLFLLSLVFVVKFIKKIIVTNQGVV